MWTDSIFSARPVIGMVHLDALPGTALYDAGAGLQRIIEHARQDYDSLVAGGIDGVIFGNENDKPYTKCAGHEISAVMTRIVLEVTGFKSVVPFGVDVQWDLRAALAVAKATGAAFVRGIACGTFCGDLGVFAPNAEETIKYRRAINAEDIKILTNLHPEFSCSLDTRPVELIAQTAVKSAMVDALGVSGVMAGRSASDEELIAVKRAVANVPIFANTGVNFDNVSAILDVADAAVCATCIKIDRNPKNRIDPESVKKLVSRAKSK